MALLHHLKFPPMHRVIDVTSDNHQRYIWWGGGGERVGRWRGDGERVGERVARRIHS